MALNWLREKMKYLAWSLYLVSAALILTLFFDFGTMNPMAAGQGEVAATVGSEKITFAEYRRAYQNLERRYQQMFGQQWTSEMAEQFNLSKQALDQIVSQRVLLIEAERIGLRATDEEVEKRLVTMFEDENGEFVGRERVQQILRSNRLSEKEFTDGVRQDVLLGKLNDILAQTIYVSDTDVEAAYRETSETAKIRWIQLPGTELADSVEVTDDQIADYFDGNAEDYRLPEQRRVDYLLVDTVKMRSEIEIDDTELRSYYDEHNDEFERDEQVRARHILLRTSPARDAAAAAAELEDVRRRVLAGEAFATIAQGLSDDEGSAQRGGDLGFFGRGAMVKPFEDAAFAAEAGTLVGPVETDFGVHLIQVEEKRPGGLQPFEEVQARIRSKLLGERVNQLAESKANELAKRIADEGLASVDQLRTLAESEEVAFQSADPFGQGDTVPGVGRVATFSDAAYGLEVGGVSDPVKIPRGFAILHLAEVLDPRIPELDDVRSEVRQDAEAEVYRQAAVERLADARTRLTGGEVTLEALAEELGLEAQESADLTRSSSITGLGRQPEVVDAALGLDVGAISDAISSDQGAVLFEVLERTTFDETEFAEQKDATRDREAGERLNQLLTSIIEKRLRDLRPQYDPRVAEDLGIQS
ncbi:MAG: peptidyl-prolyl cis-trans isomerase [Acidobacteriota bacterium]